MNPVRGIETYKNFIDHSQKQPSFKLMNPVRGIETVHFLFIYMEFWTFQINESRSRDWNDFVRLQVSSEWAFKLMNPVRGIETAWS